MTRQTNDLKYQIERILRWEPSKHWHPRDFVQLCTLIHSRTRVRLDAAELQMFWQSSTVTSLVLLNTLAQFADYDDWDDFCTRNFYGSVETDDETRLLHAPMWEIPIRWVIVICWLSIAASIIVAVLLLFKH